MAVDDIMHAEPVTNRGLSNVILVLEWGQPSEVERGREDTRRTANKRTSLHKFARIDSLDSIRSHRQSRKGKKKGGKVMKFLME